MEFITEGHKLKDNIILSEEEYNTLKKHDLIKENEKKAFINPSKITTIIGNSKEHHFFVKEEDKKILVEHLNENNSNILEFKIENKDEILPKLEEYIEIKEKINKNLNNIFN